MWFEVKNNMGGRPGHPEDDTLLIEASSIECVCKILKDMSGTFNKFHHPKQIKEVFYVWDKAKMEHEKKPFLQR